MGRAEFNGGQVWDGRDSLGRFVPAGIYPATVAVVDRARNRDEASVEVRVLPAE